MRARDSSVDVQGPYDDRSTLSNRVRHCPSSDVRTGLLTGRRTRVPRRLVLVLHLQRLPGEGVSWIPPVGGTSASAPLIAGLTGLGANGGPPPIALATLYAAPRLISMTSASDQRQLQRGRDLQRGDWLRRAEQTRNPQRGGCARFGSVSGRVGDQRFDQLIRRPITRQEPECCLSARWLRSDPTGESDRRRVALVPRACRSRSRGALRRRARVTSGSGRRRGSCRCRARWRPYEVRRTVGDAADCVGPGGGVAPCTAVAGRDITDENEVH